MEDSAHKLRRLRKEAGMTQEKLAKTAGVTLRAIQKWEHSGMELAQGLSIRKVASALGVRMEELL